MESQVFLVQDRKLKLNNVSFFGTEPTIWFAIGMYLIQIIVYFSIIVLIDKKRFDSVLEQDENEEVLSQAPMDVNQDVRTHEN